MAGATDAELLRGLARTGDPGAFGTLYARHHEMLYGAALRITRDEQFAWDVVHDTWVRAVEAAARYEGRSTCRTWLTGILMNCVRERWRSEARDVALELVEPLAASPPLDSMPVDPIDLDAAIAALPPGFRAVLVLHDVEGFRHEEIATILGIVPGTSKSQLARARERVREHLSTGVPRKLA